MVKRGKRIDVEIKCIMDEKHFRRTDIEQARSVRVSISIYFISMSDCFSILFFAFLAYFVHDQVDLWRSGQIKVKASKTKK